MISLIAAMDNNNVIGYKNDMPWHLPNDLQYFKKRTLNNTIVMGRKTFDSLGRVLPNRKHIVLTRSNPDLPKEVEVFHDVEEVRAYAQENQDEELFIIGGGEIFSVFLPVADKLYITHIDENFPGDVYFPEIDPNIWEEVESEKGLKDNKNKYDYYFNVYTRKRKK